MVSLVAYVIDGQNLAIRPSASDRDWMDRSNRRFAYRCLPLTIANAHGWDLLVRGGFSATWDGGPGPSSVTITPDAGVAPATSHFGHGILTFVVPAIFRTDPNFDLTVQGPPNEPRDGIGPLTGIVETSWAPFTFTMNWKFTRENHPVRFEDGEAFCQICPTRRGDIEELRPELRELASHPQLQAEFKSWSESRTRFNLDLQDPSASAVQQRWQKHYHQGRTMSGAVPVAEHRTRLRVADFADMRSVREAASELEADSSRQHVIETNTS